MAVTLTSEQINSYRSILTELLPTTGAPMGNLTARNLLKERIQQQDGLTITDDDYWAIRDALWTEGRIGTGKGKGGSLHILTEVPAAPAYSKERDLYKPILRTINTSWVKDFFIEQFVSQITAHQGSRGTGGKWTRPDLIVVAVKIYPFIPGKSLELYSFEVKPLNAYGVEGVFETASHSAFAHYSYLMIHVPPGFNDHTVLDMLDDESERLRVGFYTFEDPEDFGSYDLRVEAKSHTPDPFVINDFLTLQLSAENKPRLEILVK